MKKTNLILMLSALSFVGCTQPSLNSEAKKYINTSTKYSIKSVNVTFPDTLLNFKKEQRFYPNENKLAQMFKQNIHTQLSRQNMACTAASNCVDLLVDINYMRTFNLNSNTVGAPKYSKKVTMNQDSKILYTTTSSNLTVSRGIMGNMAVLTNLGNQKPNLLDEKKDIGVISKDIVKDIIKLSR